MYADRMTRSMEAAINETKRRRKIQEKYNQAHGITPASILKLVGESRLAGTKEALPGDGSPNDIDVTKLDKAELKYYVRELTEQMDLAARNLEFELAARLRDKISEINKVRKLK